MASIPKTESLRQHLRRNVLLLIASALVLNALLVSLVVVLESREDLDEDLIMSAELLRLRTQAGMRGLPTMPMVLSYQIWDAQRELSERSQDVGNVPLTPLRAGFSVFHQQGRLMRGYALPVSGGWIVVASSFWHHLTRRTGELVALMLLPAMFVFPLLGISIGRIVARSSEAMRRTADQVAQRRSDDFQPLDASSLPQEVQPLVTAFNRLLQRLAESLDSERRFNDAAAHELRTPLASIRLDAQLLPFLHEGEEQRAATRRIEAASIKGSQLLEELLTIARLPEHAQGGELMPMRLSLLLDLLSQEFAERLERAGLHLQRDFDETLEVPLPQVLHLILRNLIGNTLNHAGGATRILIRAWLSDSELELWLGDDGPGVAPALRETVFQRFTRLDESGSGSGLGLYIVRRSVERFGGSVSLGEGIDGRGAGFSLRLPLSGTRPAAKAT